MVDGQPLDTDPDIVCIGFTGEPGEAAVEATRSRQQGATDPDRESYDITCLASSWQGHQSDPKTVRDRAYELVDRVAGELAADQTLGGVVMTARVSTEAFAQEQTSRGAVATVRFVVHIEAFTRAF
ncbi:MAG: hypothetical protein IRZ07_04190 [Microbispora sp.]|nr:hypothetical protein [Microbispora sp.]